MTIRFAAIAARDDDEIIVFHVYGPTPCRYAYDEVIATFPNTKRGHDAALAYAADYPVERS